MLDIWEHSLRLGKSIGNLVAHRPSSQAWESTSNFLQLIGKLLKIDMIFGLHDMAHFVCSGPLAYDDSRSVSVSGFGTDLTRFLFAFNSLDDACNVLGVADRGSRNNVGKKVAEKLRWSELPLLKHYVCTIDTLLCNASRYYEDSKIVQMASLCADGNIGAGTRLAFHIRNMVVHEPFPFPYDALEETAFQGVLRETTRLALFTIQALAIVTLEPLSFVLNPDYDRPTTLALDSIHLRRYEDDPDD